MWDCSGHDWFLRNTNKTLNLRWSRKLRLWHRPQTYTAPAKSNMGNRKRDHLPKINVLLKIWIFQPKHASLPVLLNPLKTSLLHYTKMLHNSFNNTRVFRTVHPRSCYKTGTLATCCGFKGSKTNSFSLCRHKKSKVMSRWSHPDPIGLDRVDPFLKGHTEKGTHPQNIPGSVVNFL